MVRRTVAVMIGLAFFATLVGPGGAGLPPSDFTVEPSEALPGEVVTVSGVCADDVNEWESVWFYLDNPAGETFSLEHYTITVGVAWEFSVTIPEETSPGVTTIGKQCARLDDLGNFDGGEATAQVEFVVLAPEPEPEPEPAPEPAPVVVQPTFTG